MLVAVGMVVALSFLSGYLAGAVWRRLFSNRGLGCLQLVLLSVLVQAWLLVTWAFVGAAFLQLWETGGRTGFFTTAAFFWPAAIIGGSIAVRRTTRSKLGRRRKVVAGAGTHEVTTQMRSTVAEAPLPAADPDDGRPLPNPFGVGNRDVTPRQPDTSGPPGPQLPPSPPPTSSPPPPPPPSPPPTPPPRR